jgi:acyl-CoA synthetase (AMP-forming)/AMP-acid ligase II
VTDRHEKGGDLRVQIDIPGTEILNDWTLWTLVETRAALGDKPMLTVDGGDTITYGELYERSKRVAASLQLYGPGRASVCVRGDRRGVGAAEPVAGR